MRQWLSFLALMVIAGLVLPTVVATQQQRSSSQAFRGDLNEDGKVDIFDILLFLQILKSGPADERQQEIGNADGDTEGKVDIFDLLSMLKVVAGREEPELITWGIPISMVAIPGGTFTMSNSKYNRYESERQRTTLSPYLMGQYEITQSQYEDVMGYNPSSSREDVNQPVETVSWYDALTFCNRLSVKWGLEPCYDLTTARCDYSKNGFRLPTEAEWEFACIAGTTTDYNTGDDESDLAEAGWYSGNAYDPASNFTSTHPVGEKLPNAYGLYDMHGNVSEWCNDIWMLYFNGDITDPVGCSGIEPCREGDLPPTRKQVIRGGDFNSGATPCQSRYRNSSEPYYHIGQIGFRVAMNGAEPPEPLESLQLDGFELLPDSLTLEPGDSFTARFQISNPNSSAYQVKPSLRFLHHETGLYGEFETADTTFMVGPGSAWYDLTCFVPTGLASGALDVAWYILRKDNTRIEATLYVKNIITVINGAGISDLPLLELVSVPAGNFQMGENILYNNNQPLHEVTVSAFQIGQYEVTQRQYWLVMGENPSAFNGNDNRPVEQVSWYDAVRFCNRLSEIEGLELCYNLRTWECDFTQNGFRLPTEAEWDYACRAGTTTQFYTGDGENALALAGWYVGNSESVTHEVGLKQPNAYGLYDMHGNVSEWCNDKYYGYYLIENWVDPVQGKNPSNKRVRRGGSYNALYSEWFHASLCETSARQYNFPDAPISETGFRVARREGWTPPAPVPLLDAWELLPGTPSVAPGGTFTARYKIYNSTGEADQVKLVLRYLTDDSTIGEFEPADTTITLMPNYQWYERSCTVPSGMADGNLAVAWYLLRTDNGQLNHTGFSANRVVISSDGN